MQNKTAFIGARTTIKRFLEKKVKTIPACCCGWNEWLFYIEDNTNWYNAVIIAVNNAISATQTFECLEIGLTLNLEGGIVAKFDGLYKVVSIFFTRLPNHADKLFQGIRVVRIGAIDADLPIHTVISVAY